MGWFLQTLLLLLLVSPAPGAVITGVSADPGTGDLSILIIIFFKIRQESAAFAVFFLNVI